MQTLARLPPFQTVGGRIPLLGGCAALLCASLLLAGPQAWARDRPLPQDQAMAREAHLQDTEGRFLEAAALFRKAYGLRPHRPVYLYRAGRALFMGGKLAEALETWYELQLLRKVPKVLRQQVDLEVAEVSAQMAWKLIRVPPRPQHRAVKAPVTAAPPEPKAAEPKAVAPTPPPEEVTEPEAATAVTAPEPRPAVVRAPEVRIQAPPLDRQPHLVLAKGPESWPNTATAVLVASAGAALAGVLMAAHASTLQQELDRTRLPGSEVFDLSRTSRSAAVDGTNSVSHWYNGALGSGLLALVGAGVGTWLWSGVDASASSAAVAPSAADLAEGPR